MTMVLTKFDGNWPGNPGLEFLDPSIADPTQTYAQTQPEAHFALVSAYRTGRRVNYEQNVGRIQTWNENPINEVYNRNYVPAQRASAFDILRNLSSIGGVEGYSK